MPVDPTDPDLPLRGASPLTAYSRFWRRYVVFTGRASLSEYWWAVLINTLIAVATSLLGAVLLAIGAGLAGQGASGAAVPNALGAVLLFVLFAYGLAQLVPSIALTVRRLHDANLSGLLFLLSLIPSVGGLIVLVLTVLPSSPEGRRFDRGAPTWGPAVAPPLDARPATPSAAPSVASMGNGGFDAWPAPQSPPPSTAQLPLAADVAAEPEDALLAAWRGVGAVERVEVGRNAQPSWRRQGYVLVRRADGVEIIATHGLGQEEGAAALGPGAELYVAGRGLGPTAQDVAAGWRFTLVAAVARRVGVSGMHLPAELEQYGALSMSVPADAPADWRGEDGGVGLLLGVGLPGVPEAVATAAGEVRLVGMVPLRPEELQRILDGGREVRASIAARLAALPPEQLTSPDRPAI